MTTTGNADTHVILRGGRSGPDYSPSDIAKALDLISAAGLPRRIMVDAGPATRQGLPPPDRRSPSRWPGSSAAARPAWPA